MELFKQILVILLILLAAFIGITLIRAIFFVPKKKDYGKSTPEKVDSARAIKNLSEAIKIPTISYPEHELVDWSQFEKFHDFLEKSYPLITKHLKREKVSVASLLYKWEGTNPNLDPIALLAHQDVVPISEGTEQDWTHPPFDGVVDDEFVWGRGALDMKNHLICVMESVETLLEEGFVPERDVYLCFGHDEEVVASDHSGAKSIMETLQSRGVRLDSVIDEGGVILPINVKGVINKSLAGIGIGEKGYTDFEVIVHSKGGHSAQPPKHTALGEMADVIKDLENNQFKAKIYPFVSSLLDILGRSVTYPVRIVTCNIWLLKPLIKRILTNIPPAACMIRTTTAVTMAQGSPAANVLPQAASITVNFRQMPGTKIADIEKHIKKVVKNKDITVKLSKGKEASEMSSTHTRTYKTIEALCMQEDSNTVVAPFLVMGGTDAWFYEPICDNIYRFSPFKVDISLLFCTHATNERVPVAAIGDGVAFFKRYIRKLSGE
ncbi:MAG TPA: M20 family peptidase [Clostridia bacterium]|nr:M20 family peptidase [Clostridia bacterium]